MSLNGLTGIRGRKRDRLFRVAFFPAMALVLGGMLKHADSCTAYVFGASRLLSDVRMVYASPADSPTRNSSSSKPSDDGYVVYKLRVSRM
jgi:hypothetical protein